MWLKPSIKSLIYTLMYWPMELRSPRWVRLYICLEHYAQTISFVFFLFSTERNMANCLIAHNPSRRLVCLSQVQNHLMEGFWLAQLRQVTTFNSSIGMSKIVTDHAWPLVLTVAKDRMERMVLGLKKTCLGKGSWQTKIKDVCYSKL